MAMLLKLQESANYIESPEREGCLDPSLQATLWCDRQMLALSQLTQGVQSQQDFKNSIIKTVCSVSRYKANCKESTDRGIMDAGFSLPCYLNFRKTMKLLSQEVVVILPGENLSFLKPLFQMGCCWICKCMVNRNSMMQNITYNPFNQDPFLPFLLLLTATTSTTVIGADSTCSLCFSSQRNSPQNYLWFPQK